MFDARNNGTYELDLYYVLKSRSGKKSRVLSGKTLRCSYLDEDREVLLKDLSKFEKKVKSHSNTYLTTTNHDSEEENVNRNGIFPGLRLFTRRFCCTWRSTFNEMINL